MAKRSKNEFDQNLIRKFQLGEEEAFTEIFHELYTPLIMNAFRITDNLMIAEDIVEDIFLKLWERRSSLSDIHSLKSYLYTMTRNASLTWLQKQKSEVARGKKIAAIGEKFDSTTLENMIYNEMMAGIYAVIKKLPTQCRKVFVLHYIEGKKISEIAKELKISVGTVNTHKFRGIHILKEALLGYLILLLALFS